MLFDCRRNFGKSTQFFLKGKLFRIFNNFFFPVLFGDFLFVVCMYYCFVVAISDARVTGAVAKPTEGQHTQRSTRDVPKAPTSQSSPLSSDGAAPTTPAKGK